MKNLVIVLIFLAAVSLAVSPVFAQNAGGNSDQDMYYFNVPVERVYPSSSGYVVQYRKHSLGIGTVGIPNEWFVDAGGRAEIIRLPRGANWPSMSVFFTNGGEFSHVRLYVHRHRTHSTWGNIPQGMDVSRHFRNPDTLEIEF